MKTNLKKNIVLPLASAAFLIFVFSMPAVVQSTTTYVSLTVSGQLVPSNIAPGGSGNLILTISNGGTEYARSVKLTVRGHTHITFDQSIYNLGTIAPSDSTQISIPITISPAIKDYTTSVFFYISYTEGDAVGTTTIDTSTSVSISKRSLVQIENVTWDKDIIEPGNVIEFDVYIRNAGQGTLRDMTAEFGNSTLPFVSASGDLEIYLGDLTKSDLKIATFSIIVNKEAKTVAYSVPVTIKYYDESGVLQTDIKYIGVKVSGEPDFVVTVEDDNKMYLGGTGELTISLANRGTSTANFLSLRFDSNLDITPSEYYAGHLDPDDYETLTLSVDLSGISTGKHSLNIEMSYKDPYNQEVSEDASVEFRVRRTPIEISFTTKLIIVVVLIAVIYWKKEFFIEFLKKVKSRK